MDEVRLRYPNYLSLLYYSNAWCILCVSMNSTLSKPKRFRALRYDVHHIALSVSNRENSAAFYALLGFEPFYLLEAEDGSLTITHLKNGGIILELFCYRQYG